MTVNIVPYTLPPIRNRRQPMRRPWYIEPSCVLALMPEINTTWLDYSRHNNPAVLINRAVVHSGRWGPALKLDGSTTYGTIADSAELRFTTPFSISLWANRQGAASDPYGNLITKTLDFGDRNYQVYWADAGTISFRIRDGTNNADRIASKAGYAETGTWRNIISVFDGTDINIYIDTIVGISDVMEGAPATGAHNITIGKLGYAAGSNYHFNGLLDEIEIFNKALTASEREALFEMGKRF